MLKFLKDLFSKKSDKLTYTICARCGHFHADFSGDYGCYIPNECYSNVDTTKHLNLITGEQYTDYDGKAELCAEKNTGHCLDFKKKRSLFY